MLAGCGPGVGAVPLYGVETPPPVPYDPTLEITDFTYTPGPVVHVGETVRFTVTTNKPSEAGYFRMRIGNEKYPVDSIYTGWVQIGLNDRGYPPDDVIGDGIWHGEYVFEQMPISTESLPVSLKLLWMDGHKPEELMGTPIQVVP